jgi:hypothetical protein
VAFAGHGLHVSKPLSENVVPTTQGILSHVLPVVVFTAKPGLHVGVPDIGHVSNSAVGHGVQGGFPFEEYDLVFLQPGTTLTIGPL